MQYQLLENVTEIQLEQLAEGVLNTYQLENLNGLNRHKALEQEKQDLLALNKGNDSESLAAVRKRRGIPDWVDDDELKERVFDFPGYGLVLAGAYREYDAVHIVEIHTDFSLTKRAVADIAGVIKNSYEWHHPKYLVFWQSGNQEQDAWIYEIKGVFPGGGLYAATRDQLIVSPRANVGIALCPFDPEKDWPWYETEYTHFLTEKPQLADLVPISEKSDIEESVEAGLCVIARQQGERIGMIMAEQNGLLGFNGLLVADIFLAKASRGKGLAPDLQRAFFRRVLDRFDLYSGFIEARNPASFNTAKRQGRHLIRQEYYVPFKSLE